MYFTDDPVADYDRYCAEQERESQRFPLCSECGERIMDDFCYEINDEYICEKCMKDNHRKDVDMLIG